ncbi:MAG: XTP/dITP diphosphatase [Lachnospiraceae bacterium]|jgi:XTP/dITP diphosphohydrolase|nr:XTP/dITP diphosphatase [Lachnospiraceae bacterium]MCH4031932.1 XTP/dITP diphosphatase [Lachnospiraceae bacterium]MCH4070555.1 XTP/dITP diphosphatase [Lachnospiraceae bacterium]MCH4109223.1 XTP/dITP diphosphatase [Lachnospiraceae bacterium]MCI1303232.1 XTP/dITP diphosphatase [Lachnospiraceae bacterium]
MKKIIFASNNQGKIREVKDMLADPDVEVLSMKEAGLDMDIEENGTTFQQNALIKARAVWNETHELTIADDSGLEIDWMNGEPGVYSARFMGHDTSYDVKNAAILEKMKDVKGNDRSARFVCAMAAILPDGREITTRGTMEGVIADKIQGSNGFGYDPILYLPEYGKTSAQLTEEEKNKISHRGEALRELVRELKLLGV